MWAAEAQIKRTGEGNLFHFSYSFVCLFLSFLAYLAFTIFRKFINTVIVTANSFINISTSFFRLPICTEDSDDSSTDVLTSFFKLLMWTENQQLSRNPQGLEHCIVTAEAPSITDWETTMFWPSPGRDSHFFFFWTTSIALCKPIQFF